MNVSFDIPEKLLDKVESLLERIPYLSETITGMSYNKDDKVINLTLNDRDLNLIQMTELRESYQDLCSTLGNTRVIKKREKTNNLSSDHYIRLQPKESTAIQSPYMDESDILLLERLDKEFTRIAIKYDAELRDYPTVLNKKNMIRNQYHIHFPQNIYGVTSVPHNYKAIKKLPN